MEISNLYNVSFINRIKIPKSPSRFIEFDENDIIWAKLYGYEEKEQVVTYNNCLLEDIKEEEIHIGKKITINWKCLGGLTCTKEF